MGNINSKSVCAGSLGQYAPDICERCGAMSDDRCRDPVANHHQFIEHIQNNPDVSMFWPDNKVFP